MSTSYNAETGQYENYENAVIAALTAMDEALNPGESQEQEPETPVDDGPIDVEIPIPTEGENGEP